uniref:NADH-ubiquinone oxidoreductase chain 6 n=1 Tax=Mantura chrysanthemi TaxID=1425622 RepID=A0A3G1GS90_9CUCU|nr:NADH dehydrogenase subunit 6 [Mantura chrysanthemi]
MLLPLMMLCSIMILFLKHPLTCGLMLLMQTIMTSLITGMMSYNFWYSYILFLVMVGGMLILFIYMTSIASNEKFKFNNKLSLLLLLILIIMCMLLLIDNYYLNMNSQNSNIYFMMNNNISMNKYFNFPNNFIMTMMIIYLFITLIAVVKITKISYGPIRKNF